MREQSIQRDLAIALLESVVFLVVEEERMINPDQALEAIAVAADRRGGRPALVAIGALS